MGYELYRQGHRDVEEETAKRRMGRWVSHVVVEADLAELDDGCLDGLGIRRSWTGAENVSMAWVPLLLLYS